MTRGRYEPCRWAVACQSCVRDDTFSRHAKRAIDVGAGSGSHSSTAVGTDEPSVDFKTTLSQRRHIFSSLLRGGFFPFGGFLQGAMQLVRDTEQRLEEAEQQCHYLIKLSFNECQPCLEDTCKAFYASTCRRGFASFSFKV